MLGRLLGQYDTVFFISTCLWRVRQRYSMLGAPRSGSLRDRQRLSAKTALAKRTKPAKIRADVDHYYVGVVTKIRTVSDAKREFYSHHNRPISSIYRRFVEELLVEMHLLVVNADFHYDPIFALGVVTSFDRFMQGYQPDSDLASLFYALCRAAGGDSGQYHQDSQSLRDSCQNVIWTDLLAQVTNGSESSHSLLLQTLQGIHQNSNFKYSRLFAIGLYTLLLESQPALMEKEESRQAVFSQLAETLGFSEDKLHKDLDLYRSNLDKVEQLLKVLEETAEAERKKREKKAAKALEEAQPDLEQTA